MKNIILITIFCFVSTVAQADVAKGKELFTQRCVMCHGAEGAGDGPASAGFPPEIKPKNLKEGKFKAATDDAKFTQLIKQGGASLGLSPLMPAQSDLADAQIMDLHEFVKSLAAK